MELYQLKQFKTIAECGTLTAAAEKLYISQPALSTALRKLEEELGAQLFIRRHNRISLSAAGEIVLKHANRIDMQVEMLKEDLESFLRREGNINISFCSKGVMWYIVPLFANAYPKIHLTTSGFAEDGNEAGLLKNHYEDALVTSKPLDAAGIESVPFLRDQHYLTVPLAHPLAQQESILITEETELPEIHYLTQTDDIFCRICERFFQKFSKLHLVIYKDYFLYMHQVKNKDVISTTTELVQHFRDDGLNRTAVRIENQELCLQYYLCYLKNNKKRVEPFLNWKHYLVP